MSQPTAFGHARWRVPILGAAGLGLGTLIDGAADEIKSAIERQWRDDADANCKRPMPRTSCTAMRRYCCSTFFQVESGLNCVVEAAISVVSGPRSF